MTVLFIVTMLFLFLAKLNLISSFIRCFCARLVMFYCRKSVWYYDVHMFGNEISVKILSVKNDVSVAINYFPSVFLFAFLYLYMFLA
jgi:hypothetical protein